MLSRDEKALVDRIRTIQRSNQANKRCADCTQMGPTYICLDFRTFVCQQCSGLHREFGHKMKSISLSEWTAAEVEAVEAGGNGRAARKWLSSSWNREEFPEPDGSDLEKQREFIKMKYVEKKWLSACFLPLLAPLRSWQLTYTADDTSTQVATVKEEPKPSHQTQRVQPLPCHVPRSPPLEAETSQQPVCDLADLLSDSLVPESRIDASAVTVPACEPLLMLPAEMHVMNGDNWIADFGGTGYAADTGQQGLIDLDSLVCDPGSDHLVLEKKEKMTGSKDDDLFLMVNSPVAEPAEEPAPPHPSSGAIKLPEAASLGDQMREAMLHGNTDDIRRLYKQCSESPKVGPLPRHGLSEDKLAAFSAFDELRAPAACEARPTSDLTFRAQRLHMQTMPAAMQGGPLPQPGLRRPNSFWGQSSVCNGVTAQQLERLSQQELVQMRVMIQSVLQARSAQEPSGSTIPHSMSTCG